MTVQTSVIELLEAAVNSADPVGSLPPPAEAKAIRLASQVRVDVLAPMVGVTTMTVYRWENGNATPQTWVHAARYGRALEFMRELAK